MTAQELILKGITDEAYLKKEEIIKKANEDAELLISKAKDEAKAFSGETVSVALKKAVSIKANAESQAELILRDAKLRRKNREIDGVISKAVEKLSTLPDKEYFELLLSLISKIAENQSGEILLSKNDLEKRNVTLLTDGIKKNGFMLTLSNEAADIKSGFVLRYGDILINSSFEARAKEKRERLNDAVKDVLFK